jgi:hypothetical protein
MKSNPSSEPEGEDAAFTGRLRAFPLRPPPEAWREAILAAAFSQPPVRARWYRQNFWRGVAALWAVLALLQVDTWRVTPGPSAITAGFPPVTSPPGRMTPDPVLLSQTSITSNLSTRLR